MQGPLASAPCLTEQPFSSSTKEAPAVPAVIDPSTAPLSVFRWSHQYTFAEIAAAAHHLSNSGAITLPNDGPQLTLQALLK